jgi:hypothetical protein
MKYLILIFCVLLTLKTVAQHHKNKPTGQVPLKTKPLPIEHVHHARFSKEGLDTAVDLSPYAPQVADQPLRNCYAYASVYAGRTILYNILHNYTNKPDSTIFSPGFLEKVIFKNNVDICSSEGYQTREACRLLQDTGAVFRSDFPDECQAGDISPALWQKAMTYRIKVHSLYEPCTDPLLKIQAIKEALASRHPVVLGWNSTNSFNKRGYGKLVWAPNWFDRNLNSCRTSADHAICVVGYSDKQYGGAFRIMNSWSKDWGTGGFIWIRYQDLTNFTEFGIELSDQ